MASNNGKVTVIIPAYNAGRFLSATIASVLAQTYTDLELLVIDDGSTDDTASIAAGFAATDSRVRLISQPNDGCSGAKNTGLANINGKYIQYLDADDIISNDKLQEQVAAIADKPLAIAVCRTKIFHDVPGDTATEIDTDKLTDNDSGLEFLLNLYGLNGSRGMIQPNAFLMQKSLSDAAGSWDMSISPSPDEDGEYFCRALLAASEVIFTPGSVNYYRKQPGNPGSLSKQFSPLHVSGALRSLELKQKHLLAREDSPRTRKLLAEHYSEFIYMHSRKFPELANSALAKMRALGFPEAASAGGNGFRKLTKLIGFRNAIKLKNAMNR